MIKKIIAAVILMSVVFAVFAACGAEQNDVTLDSIKKSLTDAGYEITIEDTIAENLGTVKGFFFSYKRTDGYINIPVFEFDSEKDANDYAAIINGYDNQTAITNGKYLTTAEKNNKKEKDFLKKLLNGKKIK